MYWRPKQKNTPKPTLVPQRKQQTATKCQKKWVPKQPSQKKINDTSIKVAGTTKPTEVPTQAYSGKKSRYPTIKERARALQIKLFGLCSLPTISTLSTKLSVQEYTITREGGTIPNNKA